MKNANMKFVDEQHIDQAATELEQSPEAYESAVRAMQEEQPVLLAYNFSESFQAFTEAEQQYFLYLALIIWKAVNAVNGPVPQISLTRLSEIEEHNWSMVQSSKGKTFRERLDPFFEDYEQEDLLAFAEDALTQDEEEEEIVSREGQEALFVSLKTVIDALAQPS
jgi:hypothetical protein